MATKTIETKLFLQAAASSFTEQGYEWIVTDYESSRPILQTKTVEWEIDNPVNQVIQTLESEISAVQVESFKRITELQDQISKLQALEFIPSVKDQAS